MRTTKLSLNGIHSDIISTPAGIPQGSPLSPILYILYNSDLLEIFTENPGALKLGFIDDIAYAVKGSNATSNVEKLSKMMAKADEWRTKHGAQFEVSKYMLIHFTKRSAQNATAPIKIGETTIHPVNEARYLGVIFDRELQFKSHLQYVVKKGTKFALAMTSIAKAS